MAGHQPLVLLVDDNEEHRAIYAMVLEAAGFQVVEATDGTSAVRKARTMRPDVILLDLHLPRLNGWQACRRLKAAVETSSIPVVALTGDATEQAKREAIEAGCDRFIVKGSDRESVIQAIREVLAGGALEQPKKKHQDRPPAASSVLPMQLRVGDRFTDERGEWQIVSRPYGTVAGRRSTPVRRAGLVHEVGPARRRDSSLAHPLQAPGLVEQLRSCGFAFAR